MIKRETIDRMRAGLISPGWPDIDLTLRDFCDLLDAAEAGVERDTIREQLLAAQAEAASYKRLLRGGQQ